MIRDILRVKSGRSKPTWAAASLCAGLLAFLPRAGLPAEPVGSASVPVPGEQERARAALDAARRGDFAGAEATASALSDPLLLKIILWLDYQRAPSAHSFEEITRFIDANPDWPMLNLLRMRAEDVSRDAPASAVADWFARHKPVSAAGRLREAQLWSDQGRAADVAPLVRQIWTEDDLTPDEEQILLGQFGGLLRGEDDIARANRLLWLDRAAETERLLPRLPADWRRLAEAWLAYSAQAKSAPILAAKVEGALAAHPGLAFARLRWLRHQGKDEEAAALLEGQSHLDRPEQWWPERQLVARHLLQENHAERAYRVIIDHELKEPEPRTEAEFMAGWVALRFLHDPARAAKHFELLEEIGKMPVTLARGAYWSGRAEDALDHPDAAVVWYQRAAGYPATYYGQLAASMPGVAPPPKPEPEPVAVPAERAAFEAHELVHAVRLLLALGGDGFIKPFLNRLCDSAKQPGDYAIIADFAEDIGHPELGVAIQKKATSNGIPLFRAGYPVVWVPRNAGAEQALLLAVTRQESAFDVRAVSSSGARGLMQLLPGTASDTARALGQPFEVERLTSDGAYNVTLGQAYFDTLLATFDGSYVLAIAAYNAGPGRVEQWIDQLGDPRRPPVDPVDWVESIPFSETRNYVQRVLENLQVYRLRIGDKTLAYSLDADLKR